MQNISVSNIIGFFIICNIIIILDTIKFHPNPLTCVFNPLVYSLLIGKLYSPGGGGSAGINFGCNWYGLTQITLPPKAAQMGIFIYIGQFWHVIGSQEICEKMGWRWHVDRLGGPLRVVWLVGMLGSQVLYRISKVLVNK